jgi:hypothetical protein|tara:strand:- start:547 stop:654 length:108 start_codon:yes stop_codon:yes gene_type:complete
VGANLIGGNKEDVGQYSFFIDFTSLNVEKEIVVFE